MPLISVVTISKAQHDIYLARVDIIASVSTQVSEGRSGGLKRVRLDGSKAEFDRWWGYETLQSIKENVLQHGPCK